MMIKRRYLLFFKLKIGSRISTKMDDYGVSDEDIAKMRARFNATTNELKFQVKALQEWAAYRSLPVECRNENFLNIMLHRSQFQIKTAKNSIENYFNYFRNYPEIFQNLGKFKPSEEVGIAVTVPKMTRRFERVVILKLLPKNMAMKQIDMRQLVVIATTTSLLMYNCDYAESMRCIFDFEGVSMMHACKLNLIELYKLSCISQNMLKTKVSGIEIINAPGIIPALINIAKMVLPTNVFSKVTAHFSLSSLHNNIPIDSLPSDYGGKAESTEELLKNWDHIVEANQSFFEKIASWSQGIGANKNNKM